ncbi:VCBS repeat-containing protein, partial [Kitasatospora sp. NPDC085895]
MHSRTSRLVRVALAAAIATTGTIATTAFATTTAHAATASSVDGSITRSEIIQRAQYWLGKSIPYNQGGSFTDPDGRSYRTDCSGYVSMAWHLGESASTQSLPGYSYEIPRSELKAGDILNSFYEHVILFEKWDDAEHTTFSYYSFGSTPVKHVTGVSINAATFDSHPNGNYKALRYKNVDDDPAMTSMVGVGDINNNGVPDLMVRRKSDGHALIY